MLTRVYDLILRQHALISQGGWPFFWRVAGRAFQFLLGLLPALLFVVVMRLVRPCFLIRINKLVSQRIGHFASNTELYLCERDAGINVPKQRHVDLCFHGGLRIANKQLAIMWSRQMRIWPKWLMEPVEILNCLIPGGSAHDVGTHIHLDRDVHNLMERMPPHLSFTAEEEARGRAGLRAMNIPEGAEFICLIVRDSAYLNTVLPMPTKWFYHNYRDTDIKNYVSAAEALADRGYYVIRMGAIVKTPIKSSHPRVIDYATNGMRSDFMDIYLGAHCLFCLSTSTGFDAIPHIFGRPIAFVNFVPIGTLASSHNNSICLGMKFRLAGQERLLALKEIFSHGIAFSLWSRDYEVEGVELIQNAPHEIEAVALEMLERLKDTWQPEPEDEALQRRFWDVFLAHAGGTNPLSDAPLHGNVRARYGAKFLRENREWLE